MHNILIFPAGTEIAFEIFNSLKYSKFLNIYGATSVDDHSAFVYKNLITGLPYYDEENFIDELNKILVYYDIQFIYPAYDVVSLFLTEHQNEINATIITSSLDTVKICNSKSLTYKYFKDENFIPKTFKNSEDVTKYPVFIKLNVGCGSKGATLVNSEEELLYQLKKQSTLIISEYLPGMEYTVDCFTDLNGILRVVKARDRSRIRMGISVRSTIVSEDFQIQQIAEIINDKLNFNGAWFFQLKKNRDGIYKLLEISARIPGTMGVSRNCGINFPLLTIFNHLGMDIDIIDNAYSIKVDRAFINRYSISVKYSTIYIDLDDTLIFKKRVNQFLMMYLYQAINDNKKIKLLTRHKTDVKSTLEKHKISSLIFDEIIHISDDKKIKKSEFIMDDNSIFIDDSFIERVDVRKKKNIPVFDLDMIESLIDWRI